LGDARARFSGPLFVGREGDLFTLPAGGGELQMKNVLG